MKQIVELENELGSVVSILFSNSKQPKQKYKGVAIKPKHPRNAPCHCGSGNKFKKCCI
jgi:uncharacterized protein YchJ